MKNITLVIMAAGIGSRYGGGIKQLELVGPNGEIIMDYSIYDAIKAGFNKVVFIIRKDLEKEFKEVIGNRMEKLVNVEYVFQELNDIPEGFVLPKERKKPWGTGQAILACKEVINEPFVVINADDYYGREAFIQTYKYLAQLKEDLANKYSFCMAGFILKNTLSDNGAVTRGICEIDENNFLVDIDETRGIMKDGDKVIVPNEAGTSKEIDKESHVSMNMWGFTSSIFDELEKGFVEFFKDSSDIEKKEFLLPDIIDALIKSNKAEVKLLESKDKWFGVTYKEDRDEVVKSIKKLVEDGVYPSKLFEK